MTQTGRRSGQIIKVTTNIQLLNANPICFVRDRWPDQPSAFCNVATSHLAT